MAVENIPVGPQASPEASASVSDARRDVSSRGSRLRQPGFWNAVAGMLMAVVIACGVVAMELASASGHRVAYLRHRLDLARDHAAEIEAQLVASKREIAKMEQQAEARREFIGILSAPESHLIRLTAPNRPNGPTGLVAIGRTSAVFATSGLPSPAPGQHYSLRWIPRHGSPVIAGQVVPDVRGQIDTIVRLSPPPAETEAVELILESMTAGGKFVDSRILRGEVQTAAKD
jgi:hypothetical protein